MLPLPLADPDSEPLPEGDLEPLREGVAEPLPQLLGLGDSVVDDVKVPLPDALWDALTQPEALPLALSEPEGDGLLELLDDTEDEPHGDTVPDTVVLKVPEDD